MKSISELFIRLRLIQWHLDLCQVVTEISQYLRMERRELRGGEVIFASSLESLEPFKNKIKQAKTEGVEGLLGLSTPTPKRCTTLAAS